MSARLVERADKRKGMTLTELKAFIASCEEQGIPDHARLKVNVGMRRQLHEIVAEVDEDDLVDVTTEKPARGSRLWVLAGSIAEASHGLEHRDIPHVNGLPWRGPIRAITRFSETRLHGTTVQAGDRLLQLPGTHKSTVAAFEFVLVAAGLTYADLEIIL